MRIDRIRPDEIDRNWHWIEPFLRAALASNPSRHPERVKAELIGGSLGLASVHADRGVALVVLEPGIFDDVFCCWVPYAAARCQQGPKAWMRLVIEMMSRFEQSARNVGCKEIRIGGRNWSFLPGYERYDEMPNRLRKVL